MIYRLRKRLLVISCSSVISVFTLIFILIYALSYSQINANMDMMTDRISEGNGAFLPFDMNSSMPPSLDRRENFFTEETPFSTRFFTVWLNDTDEIVRENIDSVSSVTKEEAHEYALKALKTGKERGWQNNFRYKVFSTNVGRGIVFVDGSSSQFTARTLILVSGTVLLLSMAIILFLIILLSKRAVRPIAQSYEKQRQFVTDANHELKTPLTLILANLDIVESELGHSEWIDDIRIEGQRMGSLINQLTALSKLDETETPLCVSEFSLSDLCCDTLSEFVPMVEGRGFKLHCSIGSDIKYRGDEGAIRQLIGILLDNAAKYCDSGGDIYVSLRFGKQISFEIVNNCNNVDSIELDRLFDRFYRADKARTAGTGFGIGLSLAKSIVEKHHGDICAYKADNCKIGFRVTLK